MSKTKVKKKKYQQQNSSSKAKYIISTVLIFISILAIALFLYNKSLNNQPSVESSNPKFAETLTLKNQQLPNFAVVDSDNKVKTMNDFRDKPTFIMYWASWCPDCQRQMPRVQEFYNKYKDKINFAIINVTDGTKETKTSATDYIKKNNYTFPVYFDDKNSADQMKVKIIPTMFAVDKTGKIVDAFALDKSVEDLEKTFNNL